MVSFLEDMESDEELHAVPSWKAHVLTGGMRGIWSLSVTPNWRLMFRVDRAAEEIVDLDYQDYH